MASTIFITNDKCNVSGLVLAGSADFKNVLVEAERFDQRLAAKVISIVDVSYGGENGFNQAIELSSEVLGSVKFIQEKKVIQKYFDEISQDTGKYCFGIDDTLKCLDSGAVELLLVWENLDHLRFLVKSVNVNGVEEVLVLTPAQAKDPKWFRDEENGCEKEILERLEVSLMPVTWTFVLLSGVPGTSTSSVLPFA